MASNQGPYLHESISDFIKTVTTGGTAEQLISTSTSAKRALVQALPDNTNNVAIGGSTVVASASATARGIQLGATEVFELDMDDSSKVYVDAVTDGEGVTVVYLN